METLDQKHLEIQFINLVSALAASAMQQLGKFVNPLTGKTEVNLQGAKATIDILEMLMAKTSGNLNVNEQNLLRTTIANLQLNYVDLATGKVPASDGIPKNFGAPDAKETESKGKAD